MNFIEKKEQIKTWARENKGKIIIGVGVVTSIVITAIVVNKPKTENNVTVMTREPEEDWDQGRDIEMHFVDPENGDVLWKELCTEEYMNDMKDCGMQYEAVRELNGIKEA